MPEENEEKTEEPTEHKLREARKRGQVFKSREVVSALEFASMALALALTGAFASRNLFSFSQQVYSYVIDFTFDRSHVWKFLLQAFLLLAKCVLPLFLIAFVTVVIFNLMQVGFVFSAAPLTPTWDKINPMRGFKKLFSRQSVVELFKQLAKLSIIGLVCYEVVKGSIPTLANTTVWPLHFSIILGKSLMFRVLGFVAAAYLVLGVIDYLIQRKFFLRDMRMSVRELKDELKETEGDPRVKQRIRLLQRQFLERTMLRKVPQATAVITNPVHLAVALEYEFGKMEAPVVTAKGERIVAQQIKEIAEEYEIPVIENVGLARALYAACKVGSFIPGNLYKAVAEVLAFVYRLKKKKELAKIRAIFRAREISKHRWAAAAGKDNA